MFHRLGQRLAGLRIPNSRGVIRRRGHDLFTVGAKLRGVNGVIVFHRLGQRLASLRIPNSRSIARPGHEPFTVGAKLR